MTDRLRHTGDKKLHILTTFDLKKLVVHVESNHIAILLALDLVSVMKKYFLAHYNF